MALRNICILLTLSCALAQASNAYAQTNECDYSDAMSYDGFGWNETLGQSCEPIVCEFTQRDPDGDGFGLQDGQVCIVTEDTSSAPSFTNRETGLPVVFTPVYWDANKDIANREIQCDSYFFDEAEEKYVADEESFSDNTGVGITSFSLYHHAVTPVEPFTGWVDTMIDWLAPYWSVENGVYNGLAPFTKPYVEIVSPDGTGKRIRRWVSAGQYIGPRERIVEARVRHAGYVECRDTSGADLVPTGTLGSDSSVNYTLSNIEFNPENTGDPVPTIINEVTGEEVELVRPVWNYNDDIAGKAMQCSSYWASSDSTTFTNALIGKEYTFPHMYDNATDTIPGYYQRIWPDSVPSTGTWSFVDNIPTLNGGDTLIFNAEFIEVTENRVRSWSLTGGGYYQCSGITPSGSSTLAGLQTPVNQQTPVEIQTPEEQQTQSETTENNDNSADNQTIESNASPTVSVETGGGSANLIGLLGLLLIGIRRRR